MELLSHRDYLRILYALQRKPRRFGELQRELRLNPAQVDRAVKFLRKGLWIVPRVAPTAKGRMLIEYTIGKRGAAFLGSFNAFSDRAVRRKTELGPRVIAELLSLAR